MTSILQSKLVIPRCDDAIERHRFDTLFFDISRTPITVITAGAGYGKTTFISQAVRQSGKNTIWIRLDKSDSDLLTFMRYVVYGVRQYVPDFGLDFEKQLESVNTLKQEWESLCIRFLNELQNTSKTSFFIVFDDYHLIKEDLLIRDSLQLLLNNLPPNIQIALVSRSETGLQLSRFRALRMLIEIHESDLCFTLDEVDQTLDQLFRISLPKKELKELHTETGGWIAGLVLLFHGLKQRHLAQAPRARQLTHGVHQHITDYLDENVYQPQSEDVREFLKKTSILGYLTCETCDELLGINESREILKKLESNRLFTFALDEKKKLYVYHHLFQEFLLNKCRDELNEKEINQLHSRAGQLWQDRDEHEEALKHFLKARQFETASELLSKICRDLLKTGRLQQLETYFNRIPEEYLNDRAWLQYSRARMYEFSGHPQEAIIFADKAYPLFNRKKDQKGMGLCLTLSGYGHYQTGDFESAEELFEEMLVQFRDNSVLMVQIYSNLVFICSHLGKMSCADDYYNKGRDLLAGLNRPDIATFLEMNHGFRYGKEGNFDKALAIGIQVKQSFEKNNVLHFVPFACHLVSWSCFYLCKYKDGLAYTREGIQVAESKGFKDNAYGWLLMDAAMHINAKGDKSEAVEFGLKALDHFKSLENRWGQAYTCQVLLDLYQNSGNYTLAEHYGEFGIKIIGSLNLPFESGLLKIHAAALYIEQKKYDPARHLLLDAEQNLQQSSLFSLSVQLGWARYFRDTGEREKTLDRISGALKQIRKVDLAFVFGRERDWIIPALVDCYSVEDTREKIISIIQLWGTEALLELGNLLTTDSVARGSNSRQLLMDLKASFVPPLQIRLMGAFEVKRGNVDIPAEDWHSNKAKTIFQYLTAHREKGYVNKEVLMELLWPESSPKKSAHRLQVALSSLRKILEPENPEKAASSYLLRQGDAYRLEIGDGGRIDSECFIEEFKSAKSTSDREAVDLYISAESLYFGDFLQEDAYSDWSRAIRDNLRESYTTILNRLITHFESRQEYEKCAVFTEKYLTKDPYDESLYCRLMQYYAFTGKRNLVQTTFDRCKTNLEQGLDVEPEEETVQLFRQLSQKTAPNPV